MAETPEESQANAAARLEREDGIAWLVLDNPGKKVNTLSTELMGWFGEQLDALEADPPQGLVFISGKKDTFIAGADIEELQALKDAEAVRAMLDEGHALTQRITGLPFPVVAAIHGVCLGGGLELALACHRRLATDHKKTKLGLPEVQIGIFPGLGGTQRLPRLIGVADALPMILTGKQLDAKRAKRVGLVDEVCHPADLKAAAKRQIEKAHRGKKAGGRKVRRPLGKKVGNLLANLPVLNSVVFSQARQQVMKKTGGHIPGPLRAIEAVQEGLRRPLASGLAVEAKLFSELVVSEPAKRMMGIFFLKNQVDARAAKLAKNAREISSVGVLGAGFMGAGIAQLLAHKGYRVLMKDRDHDAVNRGLRQADELFAGLEKRRRYTPMERQLAMSRIEGTTDYRGFKHVPLVIEAVFEDLGVKHQVIRETEAAGAESLIFASNTSTLPITQLAEGSSRPENVVGMHFFSPVHKMPLLEIIRHPETSDEALGTVVAVGSKMGKTVIVVNDGPGFFTSRVLGPFINEAAWILREGASIPQIDKALKDWGWPVGPITLLDEVGLDIAHHASETMVTSFGERMEPPPMFARMIEGGRTGRKGKKGFYKYDEGGNKQGVDEEVYELIGFEPKEIPDEEIVERCWMQMLNECAYCIMDGILRDPADIDIGVIFGFGFPPFRGGICREADGLGLDYVVARLEHYAERHGERLKPAPLLQEMARQGKGFYG